MVVAVGYLYFGILNPKVIQVKDKKNSDDVNVEETSETRDKVGLIIFVSACNIKHNSKKLNPQKASES